MGLNTRQMIVNGKTYEFIKGSDAGLPTPSMWYTRCALIGKDQPWVCTHKSTLKEAKTYVERMAQSQRKLMSDAAFAVVKFSDVAIQRDFLERCMMQPLTSVTIFE